jgi:hypothetical protein
MLNRCYKLNNDNYINYGGRGISVCEEWQDVKNFIEWAEATHPNTEGVSLDRIDVNGNYEPDNCRWADRIIQSNNQRMMKNNTSGFTGVCFVKNMHKWEPSVYHKFKNVRLGYFDNILDAVRVRDDYIIQNNLPHKLSSEYKNKVQ